MIGFCPLVVDAKAIGFAIDNIKGTSSYDVAATSLQLKSKLTFPYNFERLNVSFFNNVSHGKLNVGFSVPIAKSKRTAKDYDWKDDQLTVFSSSDSRLDKFYSVHIEWQSNVFNHFSFSSKFLFQELDTFWSNTRQSDYVKNVQSFSPEKNLQFEQHYLLYDFGVNYQAWQTAKTQFAIETKYITGLVKLKDTHILRDFYTQQDSTVEGNSVEAKFLYSLGSAGNLILGFTKKNLHGRKAAMDYFSTGGLKFASHPAKYQDTSYIYQIVFQKEL